MKPATGDRAVYRRLGLLTILLATRAGELANARRMSDSGIYAVLRRVTREAAARP